MPTKKKNKSLSGEDKKLIEEIIRVDHAGEYGATKIYDGQILNDSLRLLGTQEMSGGFMK